MTIQLAYVTNRMTHTKADEGVQDSTPHVQ